MLCGRPEGQGRVEGGHAALSSPAMPDHVQIRIISLLEEAANSFEQLETLANRTLSEIPAAAIEQVDLRAIERDYVNDENEPGSEMDHIVFIKYKTDKVQA